MFDRNNELAYNKNTQTNCKNNEFKIGDVYNVTLRENYLENVVCGIRPAIVYQNNLGNKYSPNLIIIPLTTHIKRTDLITHVILNKTKCHLPKTSMAICESLTTIDKSNVGSYITTLPDDVMKQIATAAILATGGIAYIDVSELHSIIKKAIHLNTDVA